MKNVLQRTISGIIYIALIIGSLFLGKIAFGLIILFFGVLALYEFYRVADGPYTDILNIIGMITGGVMILSAFLVFSGNVQPAWLSINLLLCIALFSSALFTGRNNRSGNPAIVLMGLVYIALPLALLSYFVFPASTDHAYNPRIILGILILVWINDIMAYVVGLSIGRHRLFERISPRKSWEGVFGGTVFTFISAFWMGDMIHFLTQNNWLVLAGIVSVFGVIGDLFESMFKRKADLKDSGNIIPGHGGILDRIDSLLFVSPVAFVYLLSQNL